MTTTTTRWVTILLLSGIAAGGAALATTPSASAYPMESHTVTFTVTGSGHAGDIGTSTGASAAYDGTNYPALPWSTTVRVQGHPSVSVAFTIHDGDGPHDCTITVDGTVVPATHPASEMCMYQIPAETLQDQLGRPVLHP
jgi:hypothetical protein